MITKLPVELQSAFRTGITITSLPQCVIELVVNSLDANASRIGVRIDLEKYNLQVVDNGCGINRDQLELVGGRYMTSKCSSLADLEGNAKYYGYRGEAVASIKDACEAMVVISKPEGHSSTFSKVMKGGSEINSRVSKAMLNRPGNGTTVAVTNLFYNLPVRRRRMYGAIELEQLRHQMQAIALIHPKVSFTLRDDVTKSVVFNTKRCSDIIENFNQISKLDFSTDSFVEVTHSTHSTFKINGFVCKKTYKSKEHQYIYVNNRLIENRKLYAYFNHKLSKSFYFHATKMKSIGSGFSKNFDFDTFKKSPETSTGGDYAIFIINIMCPYKEYDVTLDPKKHLVEFKDWDEALACLAKSADTFVKHDRLLDNVLVPHLPGDSRENTNRPTILCNTSEKTTRKMSPVAEKAEDAHLGEDERKIYGVHVLKKKEKLKLTSDKKIESTANNENSLIVEGDNGVSTRAEKKFKVVENRKETSDNTPSPCRNMNVSAPKNHGEITDVNGNTDHTPPVGNDKKRHNFPNRRIQAAGRITDNAMNSSNKNVDTVPNDGVTMDTDMKDNYSKSKMCTENVHKENSPLNLGQMCCMKRPLSQGHSEHVLTQCNYDFSSKLRKRMRFGCMETSNYRTILPFVHAEIYETNFKGFKHSLSRLCGDRVRKNNVDHRKIEKNRSKDVIIDSRMEGKQPKEMISSPRKLNEPRQKKIVKFLDEMCQVNLHSKDSGIANVPRDCPRNSKYIRIPEKQVETIDCIGKDFQIDNHQLFKNLDTNYLKLNGGVNAPSKVNNFSTQAFEANKQIHEDYDTMTKDQMVFVNPKISLKSDTDAVKKNSFKESTIEDLFLSKTVFKKRCDPKEKPLLNSFQQKSKNDRMSETYRIKHRMYEFGENVCKAVDCSYNLDNSMKNFRNYSDNVDASGFQKSKLDDSLPDNFGFINCHAPEIVSNDTRHKMDAVHCSCKNVQNEIFDTSMNPITLETIPDICSKNDLITNKTQTVTDESNNNDRTIDDGKNSEKCSCEANEIISFYKLKHHCCRKQVTEKISKIHESKKWSASEVKHLPSHPRPLNLEQECFKQNHLRSPNDENRKFETMNASDNVRNINASDKSFVYIRENSQKTESQTSYEKQNEERNFMDSSCGNDESDCSSITQYNIDHSILNRNEDIKTSQSDSNKNFDNENRQFSFYFKPRISNTLKIFDSYDNSQESSENSHTFQKANNIEIKLSSSLDNIRREFIDEFSPVIGNNCDVSRGNECSDNKKTLSVPNVDECLKRVGTFEKNDFIVSKIENLTSLSPNRSNFFQFDDFNTKRSVTPLKLGRSSCSSGKYDIKEYNNYPCEGKSDNPLIFENSKSYKSFENYEYTCRKRSRKSDAPLKLANIVENMNLVYDNVCSGNDIKNSMDDRLLSKKDHISHEKSETHSIINEINNWKENLNGTEPNMKHSMDDHLLSRTNPISHGGTEIHSIINAIINEKESLKETEPNIKRSVDDHLLSQTNTISHEGSEINSIINAINNEKKNLLETERNLEFVKTSGSSKLKNSKKHSSPQTVSIFHDSLESNHSIGPVINHASPSHTVSIFHDSSEINNNVSPVIDERNKNGIEVNLKTELSNTNETSSGSKPEIVRDCLSSPQTVSIFHENSKNNNVMSSSSSGEKKIEDKFKGTSSETENISSPSAKHDEFSRLFDFDVKYLISKRKVNFKATVPEEKTKYNERIPSKLENDGIQNPTEQNRSDLKCIGEDTNNYFMNATGFTMEYNAEVFGGKSSENEKVLFDEKKKLDRETSKTVNHSLKSNFLDDLAGAYNLQLTPCSTSKAGNVLGVSDSPKEKEADWVEQILPSGLKIFIHKSTGMSSYVDPLVEHPKAFDTFARNPLLPLGMSPILIDPRNCTNEGLPDLTCDQKQNILDAAKEQKISTSKEMEDNLNGKGELVETSMIQFLKNVMNQDKIGMIQLPFQIASNRSLNCMFSIKHLEDAEVIGLLDNRFIVTMINVSSTETKKNVITLFDQHAVDERIRFESLLDGYRNNDGGFLSSDLNPPIVVTVDHNHMNIIKEFVAKFEFIGLKFIVHDDTLTVTSVPKCLLRRAEKESSCQCKELLEQGIKNLLHEQISTLLKTGGGVLSKPVTLTSIIAYEACRGAIKFGDVIPLETAKFLLKKLSQCRVPYQCAHGRPVLAPIIELPS
ncbi:hypothetical protein LSTR_LSTR011902 [Laodelphax striatellus]|uniref:DNA mismatch repair protein S5 domain-containing protein n=1 Tax=Laodelphax striatellus TaxID=195883 RepID=A0A482XSV9_LAOST|nr:hypothetical protein LSTR_LSTR011902 [Laodelphax striatellus]